MGSFSNPKKMKSNLYSQSGVSDSIDTGANGSLLGSVGMQNKELRSTNPFQDADDDI